ncbi:MAG: 50S ribosomal protein L25 [Candidatus Aminicenantes bacterium]|nr:50S ribosomal protein L25 [Candidatus Aminicenantes bacterium]MDH5714316.1 50S ribosomal protein L25 [Candidatus Aminicenantes bacterium]
MERQVLKAEIRGDFGKGEARRLRQRGFIPGIVYGSKKESIPLVINPLDIERILSLETGENTIFQLKISGAETINQVMIKDFQLDPLTSKLLHVDMFRISKETKLKVAVPIILEGEAKGVEIDGGIMEFTQREVEVECFPQNLPEHIKVDVSEMDIGDLVRVAELTVDDKVKILSPPEQVIVSIAAPEVEEVVVAEEEEEVPEEAETVDKEKPEGEKKEKEE